MSALWTSDEIAAATGGTASAAFEATGVTFDSREVGPGDLFVAMPGTVHDGHKFVDAAFAAGAAGAVVSQPVSGPHVLVEDTFAALQALGRASRERAQATVFGVTGSVGKTSTKEALYAALDRCRPGKVHRSVKSYNNHTGVPLSLARMPRDAEFAVLEMGMNNAGEIAALTRQVRPQCRDHHGHRSGAHRKSRLGRSDRRREGGNLRRPRARRCGHHPQRHPASRPAAESRAAPCRADHHLRRRRCRRACGPCRCGRRRGKPDQRRPARARADLHHLAARRALGVQRPRGPRRGRGGRRGRRDRWARARRHGRAQGPRAAPSCSRSAAARCC